MATNSTSSGRRRTATGKPAAASKSPRGTAKPPRSAAKTARTAANYPRGTRRASTPRTPAVQARQLAQRAVHVQLGAGLSARDTLVSAIRRYRRPSAIGQELGRYERRGATARTQAEHQLHDAGSRIGRELRQGRTRVERSLRDNRIRLEREVRSVRRDLERRTARVGRLARGVQTPSSAS